MNRLIYLSLFFIFSLSSYAEELEYELGKGLQVGTLPLFVGGYISVNYENSSDTLKIDDIAVLAYGSYDRLSYMLELETEDIDINFNGEEEEKEEQIHIERIFFTYEFDENYALRVGKYNSQIGFWNLMPINVLRDTTSSPMVTELLFPKFTNGLDVKYSSENRLPYSVHLMLQENEDIDRWINDDVYNNFDIDRHYGINVLVDNSMLSYMFNAGYFRTVDQENKYYFLGAFQYLDSSFKLLGELGMQFNDDGVTLPYIAYLQYSKQLAKDHEAIVRVESYSNKETDIDDTFAILGYTYRPLAPIALKAEYQWHSLHKEDKLLFSISILF